MTSPVKPQPGENFSPELLASEFLPHCGLLAAVPHGLDSEILLKLLPEASSSCAELIRLNHYLTGHYYSGLTYKKN